MKLLIFTLLGFYMIIAFLPTVALLFMSMIVISNWFFALWSDSSSYTGQDQGVLQATAFFLLSYAVVTPMFLALNKDLKKTKS